MIQHGDIMLERVKLKRQLAIWKLLLLLAVLAAGAAMLRNADGHGLARYMPYVARVSIDDIIFNDRDQIDRIKDLADDSFAKAVIISIDSPGGTAVGGEELYLAIRKLAEKKPVVAVMRGMATSAAYMSAIATDRIFAREGTVTGSIGVLFESVDVVDLADKLGIKPVNIKSGALKASPQPMEHASPEAMQAIQGVVADFYRYFIGIVKERRGLDDAAVKAVSDGRVFTGRQALGLKLIDEIGGEDEAMAWLEKEKNISHNMPIEDVEEKGAGHWFEDAGKSLSGRIVPQLTGNINGLTAMWRP